MNDEAQAPIHKQDHTHEFYGINENSGPSNSNIRNTLRKSRSPIPVNSSRWNDGATQRHKSTGQRMTPRKTESNMLPLLRPETAKMTPFRWHKRMGEARCIWETIMQHSWLLIPYTAVLVSIILVLTIRGE